MSLKIWSGPDYRVGVAYKYHFVCDRQLQKVKLWIKAGETEASDL